jgi:hypothetical protein
VPGQLVNLGPALVLVLHVHTGEMVLTRDMSWLPEPTRLNQVMNFHKRLDCRIAILRLPHRIMLIMVGPSLEDQWVIVSALCERQRGNGNTESA